MKDLSAIFFSKSDSHEKQNLTKAHEDGKEKIIYDLWDMGYA